MANPLCPVFQAVRKVSGRHDSYGAQLVAKYRPDDNQKIGSQKSQDNLARSFSDKFLF
jgi:hypothetical protein